MRGIDKRQGRPYIGGVTSTDLRKRREAAGLSIEQLAAEAGVAWRSIYRWEGGYTRPSPLAQRAIEEALSKHPTNPQDRTSRIRSVARKSKPKNK